MNPRYERVYTNTITTNGELYITDPTFTSFAYPKLKLTVLPGEYVIKTTVNEDYSIKEVVITHISHAHHKHIEYEENTYPIKSESHYIIVADICGLDNAFNIEADMKQIKDSFEEKSVTKTFEEYVLIDKIKYLYTKLKNTTLTKSDYTRFRNLFSKNKELFYKRYPENTMYMEILMRQPAIVSKIVRLPYKKSEQAVYVPTRLTHDVYTMHIATDCDDEIISIKIDYMADYLKDWDINYAYEDYKIGTIYESGHDLKWLMKKLNKYKQLYYGNLYIPLTDLFTEWEKYSDDTPYVPYDEFLNLKLPTTNELVNLAKNKGTLLETMKKIEEFRMDEKLKEGYTAYDEIYDKYVTKDGL